MKNRTEQTSANKFKRMNFFIFHLCLADIYVSLGNILTMLLWRMNNNIFYGGDIACRLVVYFQLVSVYYSNYVLITMTLDRYEAICKPMVGLSWSRRRGLVYISIAFVVSHLQGLPQVFFFALRKIPGMVPDTTTCYAIFPTKWSESAYVVYTWFMQFLIPLCLIIGCYSSIYIQVLSSLKGKSSTTTTASSASKKLIKPEEGEIADTKCTRGASKPADSRNDKSSAIDNAILKKKSEEIQALLKKPGKFSGSNHSIVMNQQEVTSSSHNADMELRQHCAKNFSKSKIKTIKLTLTVIILYIICSTPYFIGMIAMMMTTQNNSKVIRYLIVLSCLLFQLNSCVNPWIYLFFNVKRRPQAAKK